MKVLHLISGGDSGGAKTHVLSLLKGLNGSISADLVCYMEGDFSREARSLGINTSVFDGGFLDGVKKTRELIASGGYELVHCHGSRANLAGAILKKHFDIPFVSTVHSDYRLDYMGRPLANLSYGTLNRRALRKMDYRVCVSDKMRETLISRKFDPNRLYALYNGIDFSVPVPEITRAQWFSEVGCDFEEDAVVVGIAARLDPVKDVATTLRGFAEASKSCDRLRLLIAGDGQEMDMLRDLAAELGVSGKVFFAGWLSGMDGYYKSVDINVISSVSETFPYSVTEAARAKIPTVATRVGGLPKLIIPGETGALFEPRDFKALGTALLRLAEDAALRKRLGQAVYDKARSEFSVESTCARQIEIYKDVLRRKSCPHGDGVVICGAYGVDNIGDEAMLKAIIDSLRSVKPDIPICVVTRSPEQTRQLHKVQAVHTFDFPALSRALRRADAYINGGGSLIQNVTSRRSLWYYLYTIRLAKKCGCRVLMYGCGIGPLSHSADIRRTTQTLNSCVDVITLREDKSAALLSEIGVTKPEIVLAADPVLSVEPCDGAAVLEFMAENGLAEGGKYACFCLRPWPGLSDRLGSIAGAIKFAASELGLTPVFLPMNHATDAGVSREAAEMSGVPCVILPEISDVGLAMGVISRMELVVSMRLHAALLAAGSGVPAVGVNYDPKVAAFMEYTGWGECVELSELDGALIPKMKSALGKAGESERLKEIKALESLNIKTAARHMGLTVTEK